MVSIIILIFSTEWFRNLFHNIVRKALHFKTRFEDDTLKNSFFCVCVGGETPKYSLYEFLRRSLMIFIIKGFRTIVVIFIVISKTFAPICPPAFFRCLPDSGTCTELRTTSCIESTGATCSDSVRHNQVQVLSIPLLLLTVSQN